ncbi:YggN family protein [Lysobacter sp. GX 14042]|uniref:YggN family protein n=1 Tax=Lysobacter sp. GX 14042 TaxID=2907155 RepID=UPI001F18CF44|nr:YggN family protein [Lysobacter sp. GX 14042]MCE7031259.1 YggN family protein [Lysobacter sp. GX 14042]
MRTSFAARFLLLALLPVMAACSPSPSDDAGEPSGLIASAVAEATREARKALESESIQVGKSNKDLPKATISPEGELRIDGTPVAATPEQRRLLLEHRANVVAVAEAGIQIGTQAADLGLKAAGGALAHAFSGGKGDFEARMEAEGERIKESARQLCGRLPALLDSQQRLAAAMPEFVPYATLTEEEVRDCFDDKDGNLNFNLDL